MKQKFLKITSAALVFFFLPWLALAQVDPAFNPNKLIDDAIFNDTQTFGGAAGVQKFLEVKGSVLANTAPDFLFKLKEPQDPNLKTALEDPEPNLGRLRTAAELIWDASVQSGLNPQVIIVTLNKEQSLITGLSGASDSQLQKALDHAMGFDCPDATGCGNLFPGFYYQLFGNFDAQGNRYLGAAKSLMKSYSVPGGRGPLVDSAGTVYGSSGTSHAAQVGEVISLDNTTGGTYNAPANQSVTIGNRATAALYRYTPHVFNGNYNFWKFFTDWFRYPNGTLVKAASDINTYIIENGTKQLVPNFVAMARNLNLNSAITISPNEFGSYPTDKVYGPVDNTIVISPDDGKTYVFIDGIKHQASNFVLKQRGLDSSKAVSITSSELALFDQGPILTPKDGSVIKGQNSPAVYLVEDGRIKLFSSFTFSQRKAAKLLTVIPDDEINSYEKQGYVAPLDGTLIKPTTGSTVYLVDSGLKHPISAAMFKNRGFSFKSVATLTDEEVGALTIGAYTTPRENTFFKVAVTGELFEFKDGTMHSISSFVAKQRGITPDYTFSLAEANEWLEGISIPPRDGTLVKGAQSATIYVVSKGQLRGLTGKAFKNRRYSLKNVKTLPQDEVDGYAKGDVITK